MKEAYTEAQTAPVATEKSAADREKAQKRMQTLIIVAAVVVIVLLVGFVVLMASYPGATQIIRDIAIVFVAVETFIIGLSMILLIFQIQALIQVLRDEVQPLLTSVNDTASTVRGTTEFVSHNVVSPFIRLAGFSAAARQVTDNVYAVLKAGRRQSTVVHQSKGGQDEKQSA